MDFDAEDAGILICLHSRWFGKKWPNSGKDYGQIGYFYLAKQGNIVEDMRVNDVELADTKTVALLRGGAFGGIQYNTSIFSLPPRPCSTMSNKVLRVMFPPSFSTLEMKERFLFIRLASWACVISFFSLAVLIFRPMRNASSSRSIWSRSGVPVGP